MGRDDLLRRHRTLGRFLFRALVLEDVVAAGALDQFRDPADAGDERLGPFLEVNVRPLVAVEIDRREVALHLRDDLLRAFGVPHELAEMADGLVNFPQAARVHGQDIHAGLDQVGRELVLHVGRGDDEVRLEAEDRLEIAGTETAYARLFLRALRQAIEGGDAGHLWPDAEPMEDVRSVGA